MTRHDDQIKRLLLNDSLGFGVFDDDTGFVDVRQQLQELGFDVEAFLDRVVSGAYPQPFTIRDQVEYANEVGRTLITIRSRHYVLKRLITANMRCASEWGQVGIDPELSKYQWAELIKSHLRDETLESMRRRFIYIS